MKRKLLLVRIAHTVVWAFYVFVIGYVLYAGIRNQIGLCLYIAFGFIVLEGLALAIFKWKCPLTVLGYRYSESREAGFDIFLPKWLAKYNKAIFGSILAVGLSLTIYRMLA